MVVAAALTTGGTATAQVAGPNIADTGRPIFPTRSYTLSTPDRLALGTGDVVVRENGEPVDALSVQAPADRAGEAFGVVLAIDASNSMSRRPIAAAMRGARAFAAHRAKNQRLGIVTFNRTLDVAVPLTSDAGLIDEALDEAPTLAPSTRLHDAIDAGLAMLSNSGVEVGSVVVLSDGADHGSAASLTDVVGRAEHEGIRIFAVGLRSRQFDPATLKSLVVGGAFAEASRPRDLTPILDRFGLQAASEHLIRYRSLADHGSRVTVEVEVNGVKGAATDHYRVPQSGSDRSRAEGGFWASRDAMLAAIALAAALIGIALAVVLRPHRETARERLARFLPNRHSGSPGAAAAEGVQGPLAPLDDALRGREWWSRFCETLEVAGITAPPARIAVAAVAGTAFVALLIARLLDAPLLLPLALLVPFGVRFWILRTLRQRRREFADQLADNLQLVASALRAGQSMAGALAVVVEEASEPSRSEFRRIVNDERAGVPLEDAIRDVAKRMDNRDLEQVALVAMIQRESGGNTAEVLDQVIITIRERAKLRRLMETLTAQGRLAQVIVSALPLVLLLAIALINREYLDPLFDEGSGRAALALAGVLSVVGSLMLKRIVEVRP